MNVKIIVATHKKYQMPLDNIYLPLHVGRAGKEIDLGYTGDDTGDNISEKNPYYCELTGLYWAWKNLKADYVGLAHYRRHFSVRRSRTDNLFDSVLSSNDAEKLCSKYDMILPFRRQYYIESLYSHYKHTHYSEQLDLVRSIITEKYPEYIPAYDKTISRSSGYMFNMFLMKKELLDKYCTWLFFILFEMEERINGGALAKKLALSDFQARFYGRISEIIFNVWLEQQLITGTLESSKIKEIRCIHMEPINWINKVTFFLKAKFMNKKYEGSF